MSPTCVSVLVGLTMAVAPLGEAFVAPGSGFQVLHVKNTAATSSWRVSREGRGEAKDTASKTSYRFKNKKRKKSMLWTTAVASVSCALMRKDTFRTKPCKNTALQLLISLVVARNLARIPRRN